MQAGWTFIFRAAWAWEGHFQRAFFGLRVKRSIRYFGYMNRKVRAMEQPGVVI